MSANVSAIRPAPRIVNHFEVVATSSGLVMGDFKWAVINGIAIVHDGLTEYRAGVLAQKLNEDLDGFRELDGLTPVAPKQLSLVLSPVLMAMPAERERPEHGKKMDGKKIRKAA
jgi:hypothetical protein